MCSRDFLVSRIHPCCCSLLMIRLFLNAFSPYYVSLAPLLYNALLYLTNCSRCIAATWLITSAPIHIPGHLHLAAADRHSVCLWVWLMFNKAASLAERVAPELLRHTDIWLGCKHLHA